MGQVGTSWSRGTSGTRRRGSSDLSGVSGTRRRGSSDLRGTSGTRTRGLSTWTIPLVPNGTTRRCKLHPHPPSPSKFTPFCWEGLVQYMSFSADPTALLCKRHVQDFRRKYCRICQLYWCLHQSICSKTRQRDLQNCPQHPKRDLSKGDTVWWALQNCMFLGGQRDTKRWAFVWSRVVQICGVLPCLFYELIATPQGACSARNRPAKYGRGENRFATYSFTMTHVINLFESFPGTRRREHRVYWF